MDHSVSSIFIRNTSAAADFTVPSELMTTRAVGAAQSMGWAEARPRYIPLKRCAEPRAEALVLSREGAFAAEPEWKVGRAQVKITPETPVALAGYAAKLKDAGRSATILTPAPDRVVVISANDDATLSKVANALGLAG